MQQKNFLKSFLNSDLKEPSTKAKKYENNRSCHTYLSVMKLLLQIIEITSSHL